MRETGPGTFSSFGCKDCASAGCPYRVSRLLAACKDCTSAYQLLQKQLLCLPPHGL